MEPPHPSWSTFLDHHGGLIVFLVVVANGFIWWARGTRLHPEKKTSYARLIKAFVLGAGLPGLFAEVSAIRLLPLAVTEVAVVLAVASWLAALALATYWLYFQDGAETLAHHPGLFTSGPTKALGFKIVWGLLVVSTFLGLVLSLS